jgi:hypothetical protein
VHAHACSFLAGHVRGLYEVSVTNTKFHGQQQQQINGGDG